MKWRMKRRRRNPGRTGVDCCVNRRGFTLMEVLIALSVLAVTMTAAFSIFSSGVRVRSATRDRMVFDRDARLLVATMTDDFANLLPTGPKPFVSPEVIVLLRFPPEVPGSRQGAGEAQIVTYRWCGSAFQDSSLIRVVTPLVADLADSALVAEAFDKWADDSSGLGEFGAYMVRLDSGFRFGDRATLRGLEGSWVAYPEVREFGFCITGALNEDEDENEETGYCRLRVRLGAEPASPSDKRFDRFFPGSWEPDSGRDIEVGLWVPMVSYKPASVTDLDDFGGRS